MERRTINIIIILTSIIFIIAFAGVGIYYIINLDFNSAKPSLNQPEENNTVRKLPTKEEVDAQNKINYPDTLTGIIKFLDENKSTLTTLNNKEYIFYPNQPTGIYQSFGIEDGDKVQVQAKILEDNKIKWISIKKVSE